MQHPHAPGGSADTMWKRQPCENSTPSSVLHMKLLGSNPDAEVGAQEELPGKSNYFIGNDAAQWHTNISNYRRVQYHGVYPGIDLVYYGNQRQLEHDFIVAPGADPKAIRLSFSGAKHISINSSGELILATDQGPVTFQQPVIYQEIAGTRKPISGRYTRTENNEIGFTIGNYDKTKELVIDPTLAYSTYFGGSQPASLPAHIAVNTNGEVYLTGTASSADFPLVNPIYSQRPNGNFAFMFISKLNAEGSALLYSTFFGADPYIYPNGIAVDKQGNAYITGEAYSNLPIVNALQPTLLGGPDAAFVAKISNDGSKLLYSTYLGSGSGSRAYGAGTDIAVDSDGAAYVVGFSGDGLTSTNPVFPDTLSGAFLAKIDPSGLSLAYAVYLEGLEEPPSSVAVDALGEAILVGSTSYPNVPLLNQLFPNCTPINFYNQCAYSQVYAQKFNANGTALLYSTPLTSGFGLVATNAAGDAFISGTAQPGTLPVVNALYPSVTTANPFVMRLNPAGSAIVYSTYLGTAGTSFGRAVAVDASDNAYVTGSTGADFPVVNPLQASRHGATDQEAFVVKLNPSGSQLLYSTYLGGSSNDSGDFIAVDPAGDAYISGQTFSQDFPHTPDALQKSLAPPGPYVFPTDFITKISSNEAKFSVADTVDHAITGPNGDLNYTITLTNISSLASPVTFIDKAVRETFHSCTVSTGEFCEFRKQYATATVVFSNLEPGESKTIFINATAAATAGDYNLASNTATAYSGSPLQEQAFASAPVTVRLTADVALTTSLVDTTNGLLHFVHKITNLGPDYAHAALFLGSLPDNTTLVSTVSTQTACFLDPKASKIVRCPLNNPAPGAVNQVDMVLRVDTKACPTLTTSSTVHSQSIDTNSTNDSTTLTTTLPSALCAPPPPPTAPTYKVQFVPYHSSYTDSYFVPSEINNKGDLLGGDGFTAEILKNGSKTPIPTSLREVNGFNDLDQVIGSIDYTSPGVYQNGSFQAIDFGTDTGYHTLVAINNAGQIAGYKRLVNGAAQYQFIYQNGVTQYIGQLPDVGDSLPAAINRKGEIAGNATDTSYLYTHGLFVNIGAAYQYSRAVGIDSSGRVAGSLTPRGSNEYHLMLYSHGKTQDLDTYKGKRFVASNINDCGEVLGYTTELYSNLLTPILYTHGAFISLDKLALPEGTFLEPASFNNRGQIVGVVRSIAQYGSPLGEAVLTPTVLEKCGSDATIDNTADSATSAAGDTISYTITAKNLDADTNEFTVTDELAAYTDFVSCHINQGTGTCSFSSATHSVTASLPSFPKGSITTITVKAKAATTIPAKTIIMNTATLSSASTADYLSTAYTSVP